MLRIAVVEDVESDYEALREYIVCYGKKNGEAIEIEKFPDALDFICDYHYGFDLIFMAIRMPVIDGIWAAKRLREMDETVELIFISRQDQYAIQGYEVSARFYLLKPMKYSEFAQKFSVTIAHIKQKREKDFLLVKLPNVRRKIYTNEILFIEIFAHDVVIHLFHDELHVRGTLSEYEKKLDPMKFCRINSCYLVNLSYVSEVRERTVKVGDRELSVSYSRKKVLRNILMPNAKGKRSN